MKIIKPGHTKTPPPPQWWHNTTAHCVACGAEATFEPTDKVEIGEPKLRYGKTWMAYALCPTEGCGGLLVAVYSTPS